MENAKIQIEYDWDDTEHCQKKIGQNEIRKRILFSEILKRKVTNSRYVNHLFGPVSNTIRNMQKSDALFFCLFFYTQFSKSM